MQCGLINEWPPNHIGPWTAAYKLFIASCRQHPTHIKAKNNKKEFNMSKLITVFGATGQQGGAVARALQDKGYKVRAVTRNPDSSKAKELQAKGAELVQVKNMEDVASLEAAIKGAYGVFLVTNFWGLFAENPETAYDREIAQGKATGDVCKKLGVKHLVFSGLEYVKDITGKPCPHFDAKGIVEKYLDEIGVPNTSTRYSYYYENFIAIAPQKNDDGTYTMTLPVKKAVDAISVEDGGPAVAAIFDRPEEYIGKKVGISGDKMTLSEYAAIMSKVTGKTLTYNEVPYEVFEKFPFPGADELAAMFEFYDVGNPDRNIEKTRELNPSTLSFQQWAEKNKDKLLN